MQTKMTKTVKNVNKRNKTKLKQNTKAKETKSETP
jgi:hypothetical protein